MAFSRRKTISARMPIARPPAPRTHRTCGSIPTRRGSPATARRSSPTARPGTSRIRSAWRRTSTRPCRWPGKSCWRGCSSGRRRISPSNPDEMFVFGTEAEDGAGYAHIGEWLRPAYRNWYPDYLKAKRHRLAAALCPARLSRHRPAARSMGLRPRRPTRCSPSTTGCCGNSTAGSIRCRPPNGSPRRARRRRSWSAAASTATPFTTSRRTSTSTRGFA